MNIFYLDKCAKLSAEYQCDKHVVKMILESAQLLSTAHRVLDGEELILDDDREHVLYKATHVNHPCAIWCRSTYGNYGWLVNHFQYLLDEYTYRYKKLHKCEDMLSVLLTSPYCIEPEDFTNPPCCMPEEFIVSNDVVASYRKYYTIGKAHLHKWTRRNTPNWIKLNEIGT